MPVRGGDGGGGAAIEVLQVVAADGAGFQLVVGAGAGPPVGDARVDAVGHASGLLVGAGQGHGAGVDLAAQGFAQDGRLLAHLLDDGDFGGVALLVDAGAGLARRHVAGPLARLARAEGHHHQLAQAAGELLRLLGKAALLRQ